MKTIFRMLSVLLLTTGLLSSCIQIGEGIQPSKKLITRDYKVKEFNKIDAGTVGNIYYTAFSIRVDIVISFHSRMQMEIFLHK